MAFWAKWLIFGKRGSTICRIPASVRLLTGIMLSLRFLSRVAFIFNVCFFISLLILMMDKPAEADWLSLIIVAGFVLAILVNLVVALRYLFRIVRKKQVVPEVPRWLVITNLVFLVPQLILLLK